MVIGILMILFRVPFGLHFCRVGKQIWKNSRFEYSEEETSRIYDEAKAPKRMMILGIIFIIEGVVVF
ncbi:MAG TPA: hypothetical protein VFY13_00410, partial [Luteolibacter sp.]|nr:hypothetical protein [Luteolibacter sp.]